MDKGTALLYLSALAFDDNHKGCASCQCVSKLGLHHPAQHEDAKEGNQSQVNVTHLSSANRHHSQRSIDRNRRIFADAADSPCIYALN